MYTTFLVVIFSCLSGFMIGHWVRWRFSLCHRIDWVGRFFWTDMRFSRYQSFIDYRYIISWNIWFVYSFLKISLLNFLTEYYRGYLHNIYYEIIISWMSWFVHIFLKIYCIYFVQNKGYLIIYNGFYRRLYIFFWKTIHIIVIYMI